MTESTQFHDVAIRRRCLYLRLGGLTFAEIGEFVGVTRQRVQQIISPPAAVRATVIAYACGACADCGAWVGDSGHVHHVSTEVDPDFYNLPTNLTLLCTACHRSAHRDPLKFERRRPRTEDEKAQAFVERGWMVGAAKLGIPRDEYRAQREAGKRWCSDHKQWEPAEKFGRVKNGISGRCIEANREASRRRYAERKAVAS